FIKAVRHIASLREDEKFGSWLFGIAHQQCIQQWRKKDRQEMLLDEVAGAPPGFEDGPDQLLVRREQEAEFMKSLDQLPLPQRSVLLLHFVEDFSLDAIRQNALASRDQASAQEALPEHDWLKVAVSIRQVLRQFRWHLAGLSAGWLLVALLNIDPSPASATTIAKEHIPSPRQLLAS